MKCITKILFKGLIPIISIAVGNRSTKLLMEEPGFQQLLVHPIINEDSPIDSNVFRPYYPTVDVTHLGVESRNCDCGVHDSLDPRSNGSATHLNSKTQNEWVGNGNVTDKNQFPFMAALIYRKPDGSGLHFCGGTLISNKLILTATHCLIGKSADKTEIWLNERDLLLSTETDHPTLKMKARRFIPHPEYNPTMNYNDIALIELTESVDVFQTHLRPICLPPHTSYEPTQHVSRGYTAGWGQTKFDGPQSDHLRHVAVPLLTNTACKEESEHYYKHRVTTHMICAGDLEQGGPDACPGDSGGPLFIKHNTRFRLVGIVSWGERCSEPRKPGVYTRVAKYLRWILKIHQGLEGSMVCRDEELHSPAFTND